MTLQSFPESLKSSMKFFEISGLQNFNANEKNFNDGPSLTRFLLLIVRLSVIILILIMFINELILNTKEFNKLIVIVEITLKSGKIIVICTAMLQTFLSTLKLKKVYYNFKTIFDMIQRELYVEVNLTKQQNIFIVKCIVIWIIQTLFNFIPSFFLEGNQNSLIVSFLTNNLILITIFYFGFLVNISNEFLKSIVNILHEIPNSKKKTSVKFFMDENSKVLKTVREAYNIITEVGDAINEVFGFLILLLIFLLVCSATVSGYRSFTSITENGNDSVVQGKRFGCQIIVIYNYFIPDSIITFLISEFQIFILILFCNKTASNVGKLSTVLNKLECDDRLFFDEMMTNEMIKFYVQINHKPLRFTAADIYEINLALFSSINIGMLSYQIILVQFHND